MSIDKNSQLFYPLRVLTHLFRLPKYIAYFEAQDKATRYSLAALHKEVAELKNVTYVIPEGLDEFYKLFEDTFRGQEKDIKLRVSEHLPLFKALSKDTKELPIIDIGCGRGEFLSVMKANRFNAIGIDTNKEMVDRCNKLGFTAVQDDALHYLSQQPENSIAAITGFHIVEHISFENLLQLFKECLRVISPQGFVLFETPNPATVTVGANSFYLDPSHIRPLPSGLLSFMLGMSGFQVETMELHRLKPEIKSDDEAVRAMHNALYGPADYAVIARKPKK